MRGVIILMSFMSIEAFNVFGNEKIIWIIIHSIKWEGPVYINHSACGAISSMIWICDHVISPFFSFPSCDVCPYYGSYRAYHNDHGHAIFSFSLCFSSDPPCACVPSFSFCLDYARLFNLYAPQLFQNFLPLPWPKKHDFIPEILLMAYSFLFPYRFFVELFRAWSSRFKFKF